MKIQFAKRVEIRPNAGLAILDLKIEVLKLELHR